jgi:glucose dehydrogenase
MKSRKHILIMLVGLLLVAFAAAMAQTPAQGDQKKKTEACCAMESCCSGDSCEMMKDNADTKNNKDGCCAESCDMTKHDAKHDGKDHKDHKDCCKMKQKDKAKKAA